MMIIIMTTIMMIIMLPLLLLMMNHLSHTHPTFLIWQVCRQLIINRGVIPVAASQFPNLSAALIPAALDLVRVSELPH